MRDSTGDPFGVLNVTASSSSATTAMSMRYVIIVAKRRWSDTGVHLAGNTVVRMTQLPEVHMETTRDYGPVHGPGKIVSETSGQPILYFN